MGKIIYESPLLSGEGLDYDFLELKPANLVTESTELRPAYIALGVRGDSAYEIAVRHGFEGTEEEWLETVRGPQGVEGPMGAKVYKISIFKRTNATSIALPYGGTFDNPVPSGWYDFVPDGEERLLMSTRVFTSNGEYPQDPYWSIPKPITSTSDLDVRYSTSEEYPGTPGSMPSLWVLHTDNPAYWIAFRTKRDGEWSQWGVTRTKGEKGDLIYTLTQEQYDALSDYDKLHGKYFILEEFEDQDTYSRRDIDLLLAAKADKSNVYTKAEMDEVIARLDYIEAADEDIDDLFLTSDFNDDFDFSFGDGSTI